MIVQRDCVNLTNSPRASGVGFFITAVCMMFRSIASEGVFIATDLAYGA